MLSTAVPGPHAVTRYALAFLVTALAFLLTFLFQPLMERSLFLFFFIAVAVSAWCGGLGPGLIATVLAVAIANYFFISPFDRWPKGPGDLLALSVFGLLAVTLSSLGESRRVAQRLAKHEAMQAQQLARSLQEQASELQRSTEEATALAAELTRSNQGLMDSVAEAEAARTTAEAAVGQLRERETAQQFLLEAARVLASSLDLQATLNQMTALLVPRVADFCLVHMQGEDGSFQQVAAAHAEPEKVRLLEELGRFYQPKPDNPISMVARAWKAGTLVLTENAEDVWAKLQNPEARQISRQLETRSYAVLPLIARGTTLGTILVATSSSGRGYSEGDVSFRELLELFAGRAALALDNARLYTEVRLAHDRDLRTSQLESQLMQARLEALRAQLNPHFLFNALNTIAMLVRRQANTDALQGIVGLSQLLRQVLDRHGEPEVTLGEELALVQHYLTVEELRFQDRLGVSVSVPPEVLDARVPSLILQPLVENAVRHGVSRRGVAGQIAISGRRHNGTLRLEVRDNGPGFPEGWDPAKSAGIGLANTRERLHRLYGATHRFKARNGPQGGAVVSVTIPFRPLSPV